MEADAFAPNYYPRQSVISTIIAVKALNEAGEEELIKAYGAWEAFGRVNSRGTAKRLAAGIGRRITLSGYIQLWLCRARG